MKKGQAPPPQPEPVVEKDEFKDLPQSGFGRFNFINGTLYVGNWKLLTGVKVKHGHGKITFQGTNTNELGNEEYEGDWEDDLMHGYGTYKFTSGAVYQGQWQKGQMHGLGTMKYADGSSYTGQWEKNLMHGDGTYIDMDQIKWEGIFVNGSYESKIQKKLQQEKLLKVKRKAYEEKAREFFQHFQETFAKSDKKTFKDNLLPFFANAEHCSEFVSDPYPKFEEKQPDKWNEWFKILNGDGKCKVRALSSKEDSLLIPSQNIQVEQLREKAGGQLVEIQNYIGDKMFSLVLCELPNESWVIVYYNKEERINYKMNVDEIDKNLKIINFNGVTLNIEEKLNLQLSFAQLKADFPGQLILLWGKVIGTVKDYYIAFAMDFSKQLQQPGFPLKRFFWSSSTNFIFSQLPDPQQSQHEKYRQRFELINNYFTGEYDRIIFEVGGQGVVIDEDLGIVLPPKNITELDRLSFVVHSIENACQAVPKGSLKFTPTQEVRRNEAFKGLSKEEAFDLSNWVHWRKIQHKEKIDQMQREESVYNHDFLDNVSEDLPKHTWSILKDGTETVATLRSLLWPGFYAYHKVNTGSLFGSIYIGDGIRSNDLPFMI